jgi:hypothetical protein
VYLPAVLTLCLLLLLLLLLLQVKPGSGSTDVVHDEDHVVASGLHTT